MRAEKSHDIENSYNTKTRTKFKEVLKKTELNERRQIMMKTFSFSTDWCVHSQDSGACIT